MLIIILQNFQKNLKNVKIWSLNIFKRSKNQICNYWIKRKKGLARLQSRCKILYRHWSGLMPFAFNHISYLIINQSSNYKLNLKLWYKHDLWGLIRTTWRKSISLLLPRLGHLQLVRVWLYVNNHPCTKNRKAFIVYLRGRHGIFRRLFNNNI